MMWDRAFRSVLLLQMSCKQLQKELNGSADDSGAFPAQVSETAFLAADLKDAGSLSIS